MPSSIGDRLYELMRRPSEERQKYRVIPPKVSLGMKFEDGFYGGDEHAGRQGRERGGGGGSSSVRIETDTMGEVEVPAEALYGAQTQRSLENFRIGGEKMPFALVHALGTVSYTHLRAHET